MTKLERKWWFAGPVATLAVIVTRYLMDSVGIQHRIGWAELAIFILCVVGLQRTFSVLGWLLVLFLSPADKAIERTR
jgi:hypothetical protein